MSRPVLAAGGESMEDRQGPYVVTEDVEQLLTMWADAHGFRAPSSGFFGDLRGRLVADLEQCLAVQGFRSPQVLYLRHDDLRKRAAAMLAKQPEGAPFVTLDRLYFPDVERFVDVTRHVVRQDGGTWVTLPSIGVRSTCDSLSTQVRKVMLSLPRGIHSIRLLDDGLWTGTTTLSVTREFEDCGIAVVDIFVALLVESLKTLERLREEGHPPIHTLVQTFPVEEGGVIDWVCERDFFPGVPTGGRTVSPAVSPDGQDVGAYYLDLNGLRTIGDPVAWATLDGPSVSTFSRRRIEDCISLFEAIEDASGRSVTVSDLDRIPYGFGADLRERFVDVLRRQLDQSPATKGGPNGPR